MRCRAARPSSPTGASTVSRRCSPRATTRCSSAAARRAGATSTFPAGARRRRNIHIGIDWLASVAFGHVNSIGKRVIVLGGGNTAMDCCRTSLRLGGADVKVIVRSGFEEMKASPWEKEDAMHEGVTILNYLVPKAFLHDNGKLTGMSFEKVAARRDDKGRRQLDPDRRTRRDHRMRRRADRGRTGERLSLDRAGMRRRVRRDGLPKLDPKTFQSTHPEGVLRRRFRVRAEEHHHGGRARPRRGDLDRRLLPRRRA